MNITRKHIQKLVIFLFLVSFGVLSRLFFRDAGLANVEMVTVLSLIGAYIFSGSLRFFLPMVIVVASDQIIGNTHFIAIFTWGSWLLVGILSAIILKKKDLQQQSKTNHLFAFLSVLTFVVIGVFGSKVFNRVGEITSMWVVVGTVFALILGVGLLLLSKNILLKKTFGVMVLSGSAFFLITNFGVWMEGWMYEPTFAGLMKSYQMGLPFFEKSIRGNVVFVPVGFYMLSLATQYVPRWISHLVKETA